MSDIINMSHYNFIVIVFFSVRLGDTVLRCKKVQDVGYEKREKGGSYPSLFQYNNHSFDVYCTIGIS